MKRYLTIQKNQHQYKLEWQKKDMRRFILKFKEGCFILSTPKTTTIQEAMAWLETLDEKHLQRLVQYQKVKQGEHFVYLFGKRYSLDYQASSVPGVIMQDEVLVVCGECLSSFLEEQLRQYATKRLDMYYHLGYVSFPVTLQLQKMTSRYGVCFYHKHTIKLAKALVHEPPEVIDAIMIHELGHFYYPNHSPAFYQWVYNHCPSYEKHRLFLKQGGVGDEFHYISE